MIISHKHRFIFIRPFKTAGTSIEINLSKHCGPDDVIVAVCCMGPYYDEFSFHRISQNCGDFNRHERIENIKHSIGDKRWNEYFKFTVVRNPWDHVVSRYWWQKAKFVDPDFKQKFRPHLYNVGFDSFKEKRFVFDRNEFHDFIRRFKKGWYNEQFYFDSQGKPCCNYYMKFEDLEEEYRRICERLGIQYEALPKTKNIPRKNTRHYSFYYDPQTISLVRDKFKKEIDFFGYEFETISDRSIG